MSIRSGELMSPACKGTAFLGGYTPQMAADSSRLREVSMPPPQAIPTSYGISGSEGETRLRRNITDLLKENAWLREQIKECMSEIEGLRWALQFSHAQHRHSNDVIVQTEGLKNVANRKAAFYEGIHNENMHKLYGIQEEDGKAYRPRRGPYQPDTQSVSH